MRIFLVVLITLGFGAGCRHLVTSEDRAVSPREVARLKARFRSPESLGIQVSNTANQTSVRWQERLSPSEPVTVPLLPPDTPDSVQPVVEARLNDGDSLPLVLDTGAPVNLMHLRVALDNSVPIADPRRLGTVFQGFGGFEPAYYGMIDRLEIGEMRFRHAFTAIRTRTHQRKLLGLIPIYRWEGNLVGLSSLVKLNYLTIDYPSRSATFSTRQSFPEPERPPVARLPFKLVSMQIRVDLRLGATNQFSAVLDTGNDASLMLPTNLVRKLGYQHLAAHGKPGKYLGLGGELATRTFTIPRIRLGGMTLTQVDAVTAPETYPVSVGSGLLKDYRVTIDFRRKVIWLEQ